MIRVATTIALVVLMTPIAGTQFRSSTDAVRVDVLATNGRQPIGSLTSSNFELRDNGVIQRVEDLQISEVPFSLMMALDISSSMEGRSLAHLKDGARAALEALQENDRVSVLAFSEAVSPATSWNLNRASLGAAIEKIQANGSTSVYDAALSALVQRDLSPGRRNLLIIFSDGRDTSSWLPDFAALDLVARTDIVVYAVTFGSGGRVSRTLDFRSGIRLSSEQLMLPEGDFLTELAERSGGERLTSSPDGLRKTFQKIVNDFRSRYVLTYTPQNVSASGWHKIDVRLLNAKGAVTARRGYERGTAQ